MDRPRPDGPRLHAGVLTAALGAGCRAEVLVHQAHVVVLVQRDDPAVTHDFGVPVEGCVLPPSTVLPRGDLRATARYTAWRAWRMLPLFWLALLTHVNPYTRTSYAQEPCVAMVEINNENGLISRWWEGKLDGMPAPYVEELRHSKRVA